MVGVGPRFGLRPIGQSTCGASPGECQRDREQAGPMAAGRTTR